MAAHREALIAEWKHDHGTGTGAGASGQRPPWPSTVEAFMRLVEDFWDAEATRAPPRTHTTVAVHLDVEQRTAALHVGPLLTDAERRYLTCDATGEVWFERHGEPIGAGRATRLIHRRLRRALEHRDRMCAVPGCGATRGSARPSPAARGRRRRHRVGQSGAVMPLSSPVAPSWRPHHHRTPQRAHRQRQRRSITEPGLTGAPTHTNPHPPWRPARDLPANAPTGGGIHLSNPNHHQTTN